MLYEVFVPIRTVSELNIQEHWTKKAKRHRSQKKAIHAYLNRDKPKIKLPCIVKLTRISKKELDDDNLICSLKWIKDAVADYIIPGLRPGIADGDKRIRWEYSQNKGFPRGITVTIKEISVETLI